MADYEELYELVDEALVTLEPFAKRAACLFDNMDDDITHWHPAVGSPISVGDLRKLEILYNKMKTELSY